MKCPKCKSELIQGNTGKQEDGTEYFELRCPNCGSKFADIKMPYSALANKYI